MTRTTLDISRLPAPDDTDELCSTWRLLCCAMLCFNLACLTSAYCLSRPARLPHGCIYLRLSGSQIVSRTLRRNSQRIAMWSLRFPYEDRESSVTLHVLACTVCNTLSFNPFSSELMIRRRHRSCRTPTRGVDRHNLFCLGTPALYTQTSLSLSRCVI